MTKTIENTQTIPNFGNSVQCNYELFFEGTKRNLVFSCKTCKGARSIQDPMCFSKILEAYSKEFNIDLITLSGDIEAQYYGNAISTIQQILEFSRTLETFALGAGNLKTRDNAGKAVAKQRCSKCPSNSERLFRELNDNIKKDISGFGNKFSEKIKELSKMERMDLADMGCKACINGTLENLNYVYKKFEDLIKDVFKTGFSIVLNLDDKRGIPERS